MVVVCLFGGVFVLVFLLFVVGFFSGVWMGVLECLFFWGVFGGGICLFLCVSLNILSFIGVEAGLHS